jgi:hypothetical protein
MGRSRRPTLDLAETRRWQHTARRHARTLRRWFAGALPGGADGIPTLLARLDGPLAERRRLAAAALVIAHLRGDLHSPGHWRSITGVDADPREIDRVMDQVWDALVAAGLVQRLILYHPGVRRHSVGSSSIGPLPPRLAARWVRFPTWCLYEQDEDLFLFEDAFQEPLLRAAAEPDAAKRENARAIVAHAARDQANACVVVPEFHPEPLGSRAPHLARLARVARETGAAEVAAYLERLASYGLPRRFTADEARQAFLDLARCGPGPPGSVRMTADDRGWTGSVPHSSFATTPRVHVDRETGVIARVKPARWPPARR